MAMRKIQPIVIALALFALLSCVTPRVDARADEVKAPAPAPCEKDILACEKADAKSPPAPGGVLFVGSSSIRMWTTLADDFPGVPTINRGFGGSKIAHSTRYADRIVIPYKPRTIIF